MIETKFRQNQIFPAHGDLPTPIPGGGLAIGGIVAIQHGLVCPNLFAFTTLQQGQTAQQRIGSRVTPKGFYVKIFVRSEDVNVSTNPYNMPYKFHVLFYKNKAGKAANGEPSKLLQRFNNTVGALEGTAWDELSQWNRDEYVIKKYASFKMKTPPATTSVATTSGNDAVLYNSDYGSSTTPVYRTLNFKIPIAKTWTYRDGGDNIPANDYLSMGLWFSNADGNSIAATHERCRVYVTAQLYYTDL